MYVYKIFGETGVWRPLLFFVDEEAIKYFMYIVIRVKKKDIEKLNHFSSFFY